MAALALMRMERGVFSIPDKDVSQLKQLLTLGPYEYLQVHVRTPEHLTICISCAVWQIVST